MHPDRLLPGLRLCCDLTVGAETTGLLKTATAVIRTGATMIRCAIPNSETAVEKWALLSALCRMCKSNGTLFLVREHLLAAKALDADGVHLSPSADPATARRVMGNAAVIGRAAAHANPAAINLSDLDYLELPAGKAFSATAANRPVIVAQTGQEVSLVPPPGTAGVSVCADALLQKTTRAPAGIEYRPHPATGWQDEFNLIQRMLRITRQVLPDAAHGLVPPGDDACLLSALTHPVISTDTHRENVHFRRDWQTLREIGRKAVTVALSDLAASYAWPVCAFVNLALPAWMPDAKVEDLYRGIADALIRYGCLLGGGNLSAGEVLAVDLFVVGEGRGTLFPKRSAARPGDGLYATGPLGLARAGLEALRHGRIDVPEVVDRFKNPAARFDAAEILAAHDVRCVMDISDGLSGDARHLAEASGLTLRLDLASAPVPDAMAAFCRKYGGTPGAYALAGGEDYELLFTCAPERFTAIRRQLPLAVQVGWCLPWQGNAVIGGTADLASWQHGEAGRPG